MDKIQQAIVANIGNRLTQQLANGLFHDISLAVAEMRREHQAELEALRPRINEQDAQLAQGGGDAS